MTKATPGPTTSVALATFRGKRFLEDQLSSIAAQSHPVDEVVIADDCSTDGTAELAESLAFNFALPARVLRSSQNLGVAANFERAMRACRGEIVFLCDQDDIWHVRKVERILAEFEARPALLAVFTDAVVVDEYRNAMHPSLLALSRLTTHERARIHEGRAFDVLMTRNVATGATMATRASSLQGLFPVPPTWYHDEWIAINLALAGKLDVIEEPLIEYRQHDLNAIGAPRLSGLRDKLRSLAKPSRRERQRIAQRSEEFARHVAGSHEFSSRIQTAATEKCLHLRVRADLPSSVLRRLPLISRELASARYFRYSHGVRAALRDLFQVMD